MAAVTFAIMSLVIALWLIYIKLDDINDTLKRVADSLEAILEDDEEDDDDDLERKHRIKLEQGDKS